MQMVKKKKSIKIDFPHAAGNYWQIMWIEQVYYQRKQRKIEVLFCNKESITNDKFNPDNVYKTKIVISYLSDFGIGSIYNVEKESFENFKFNEVYRIKIEQNLYLAKNIEFPLNNSIDFLKNSNEIVPLGFNYLKAFGESNSGKSHILISPYTILQYFLFYNDKLISKAMSGRLVDGFELSEMKFRRCDETGERIGMLRYDAKELTKQQATIVAPYIFLKNNSGIKFLRSLHSHVEKAFLNSLNGLKRAYLSFHWQDFRNYEITVVGKSYSVDTKKYLLGFRICNFQFNDANPYIVDKIELFPYNAKDSTDDRDNHEPEDVDRVGDPQLEGISLNLNADTGKPFPLINSPVTGEILNPFNIQVDVIKRDKQLSAYNVNYIPNDQEIKDLIREVEDFDNESKNIIENIKNIIAKANKFEYFKVLVSVLERDFLSNDPNFKINLYSHSNDLKTFYIAEVIYQFKAMYLVEFGSGIIGIFNTVNLNRLETEYLYSLVNEFIEKESEIEQGKIFWTFIKNEYKEVYEKRGIIIHMGAKHLQVPNGTVAKNKKEALQAATHRTAKNIYQFRIKGNIT